MYYNVNQNMDTLYYDDIAAVLLGIMSYIYICIYDTAVVRSPVFVARSPGERG